MTRLVRRASVVVALVVIAAALVSVEPAGADAAVKCAPAFPLGLGAQHALSVASDGTVKAWGENWAGELGDGSTTNRSWPVTVADLTNAVAVAGGASHSLAVTAEKTVYSWGYNVAGELGDGTFANRTRPTLVSSLTDVIGVSAGNYHSLGLRSDGTVWAWGYNYYGQLGRGTTSDSPVPVQVTKSDRTALTGVTAIAAGGYHSLAVRTDGTVWAWGNNSYGQLGDGTFTNRTRAVQVGGLSGSVTSVAAGIWFSVARRSDGTVLAWGDNDYGQLGRGQAPPGPGNYESTVWPAQTNISDVADIEVGSFSSIARRSSGEVWTWGSNSNGQLGNGTYGGTRSWPARENNLSGGQVVAMGGGTSGVVTSTGAVKTWGYNAQGQVGNGSLSDQTVPVSLAVSQSTPGAPSQLEATAGEGSVYLRWSAPTSGSKTILQYVVTPYVNGVAQNTAQIGTSSAATSYTMTGLAQGTTYTFTVAAQNCLGNGTATAQSNRVIPTGVQVNDEGFKVEGTRLTDRLEVRVNTFNGNLAVRASDLNIKGTGLSFALDRTYNNRAGSVSSFGNNWSSNTGDHVRLDPLAYGSQLLHAGGGTQIGFAQNPDGTYVTPAGVAATLVRNADTTFALTFHDSGERWLFNASGARTQVVDRNNNTISFAYGGPGGRVSTITDSQGRVTTFAYNADNLVASVTDPASRVHLYGYDGAKNLITYTDPALKVTSFAYTAGNLTQITTPAGRVVSLGYDASRRVTSMSRPLMPGTPTTTFTYNVGNTVVRDARSNATTYFYDEVGRTTRVVDANGVETSQSYTSASNVSQVQTGNGTTSTTFSYDGSNNLNRATTKPGAFSAATYDDAGHPYSPTETTDPQNQRTALTYDANGNVETVTNGLPVDNQIRLTYNANGTVATSRDPRGNVTSYGYDPKGNVTSITPPAPLGSMSIGYDALGRVASVTDGKGQTTTHTFDALDRLVTTTYGGGATVTRGYDDDGNVTSVTDGTGTTTMTYDGMARLTQRTTQNPATTVTYVYDAVGNLTSLTDAGGTTTYAYNAVNLADRVTDPANDIVTLGYDANYNRTSVAYPNGVTMYSTYDQGNRLVNTNAVQGSTTLVDSSYGYNPSDPRHGSASSITLRGSSSRSGTEYGGGLVIPRPAGVVAGDVLVASVASTGGVTSAPSGWTELGEQATGGGPEGVRQSVYWKVASGSEPSSYSWSVSGDVSGGITAWTGVDNAAPIAGSQTAMDATAAYYGTAVLADGPKGYWRLGGSPIVNRVSPYDTASWTATLGRPGALTGDADTAIATGQTQWVRTQTAQWGWAYSLEAWVKTTSTAIGQPIVAGGDYGLNLSMGASGVRGVLAVTFDTPSGSVGAHTATPYNDGQWHHVVGVWNGSNDSTILPTHFTVYVDGAPTTTVPLSSGLPQRGPVQAVDKTMISRNDVWGSWFTGDVDEVAVYDKALTAERVAAHYQAGRTVPGGATWTAPSLGYLNGETSLTLYGGRLFSETTGNLAPPAGYSEAYDVPTGRTRMGAAWRGLGTVVSTTGTVPVAAPNGKWVARHLLLRPRYDAALRMSTPKGNVTYDALNRVTATGDGYGYVYDGASNRVMQTKGTERVDYINNAANQLTSLKKTITLVGTTSGQVATGSSLTVPLPTGTQAGDQAIVGVTTSALDTASAAGYSSVATAVSGPNPSISRVGTGGTGQSSPLNSSFTVPLPAGVQANDQILLAVTQTAAETATVNGYTQVAVASSGPAPNDTTTTLYRRTATGGESEITIGSSPGAIQAAVAEVYRGVDPRSPVDALATAGAVGSTTLVTPSVTPTTPGQRLLVFQGAAGNTSVATWTAPPGMTERSQNSSQSLRSAGVADQSLASLSPTGTRTSTLSTTANLAGVALTLRPASAAKATVLRRTVVADDSQVSIALPAGTAAAATVAVYRNVDPAVPIDATSTAGAAATDTLVVGSVTASVSGDRLVVVQGATNSGAPGTWTPPSAATQRVQAVQGDVRSAGIADQALASVGATGSRSTSVSTSQPAWTDVAGVAVALRPATPAFTYDANGNLTSGDGLVATYSSADRTLSMSAAGTTTTFGYRGAGQSERTTMSPVRRVSAGCGSINACQLSTTALGTTATFQHTALGISAETIDGATTYYLRDPRGALLSMRTATATHYYLLDGQGSVVGLTNNAGNLAATYEYDPYGRLTAMTSSGNAGVNNPWRYTSAYQDGSGLYKMGERYYDPALGRFTQQDPVFEPLDPKQSNRYAYVGGDPINFSDPSGLSWRRFACGALIGASLGLGLTALLATGGTATFLLTAGSIAAAIGAPLIVGNTNGAIAAATESAFFLGVGWLVGGAFSAAKEVGDLLTKGAGLLTGLLQAATAIRGARGTCDG